IRDAARVATQRAGVSAHSPMLARPTCLAIPAALAKGAVASAESIGNRTYTGLGDDELYAVIPAIDLERVADEVETIVAANLTLAEYHRERRQTLETNPGCLGQPMSRFSRITSSQKIRPFTGRSSPWVRESAICRMES